MWKSLLSLSLLMGLVGFIPVVRAGDLAEIQQRGKLIVAVKDNLRPLGFYDQAGQLQGLEIDLAKALAEEILGSAEAVILEPVTNQQRLEVVLDGKVDITIALVAQTPSRARLVDFSEFYYVDSTSIITKKNTLERLDQLASAKIVVLENSSTIAEIRYKLPKAQLIPVNSYQKAQQLLENNQADAFAGDTTVLVGWQQEQQEYHLLKERIGAQALCVVLPKGLNNTDLLKKINTAITRWRETGWLRQRATYWGLP